MELEEVDDMVISELEKRHVMIFSFDDLLDLIPNYEKYGDTIVTTEEFEILKEKDEGNEHLLI